MANEITTMDQADGLRDQAWRALSLHPSTTMTLATALGTDAPACIAAAIAKTEHDMRPVPRDAEGRAGWDAAIDTRLTKLAAKVLPTAKAADTKVWRESMAEALSDLPAMVSLTAAKRAIHRPFRFIGEIETEVRAIAAEILAERHAALAAFRRHAADIDRALNPPAAALASPAADEPFTAEQIRKMSPDIRSMGLKAGFMTQAEVDDALGISRQPDEQMAA
jgi:hypothetical protein